MNQNAGRLVRQVKRTGESILITDRGQPVAVLSPTPAAPVSAFDRLARNGHVHGATANIEDIAPVSWSGAATPTEVLRELRGGH